jgi:CRP-like cAMP-binding protein
MHLTVEFGQNTIAPSSVRWARKHPVAYSVVPESAKGDGPRPMTTKRTSRVISSSRAAISAEALHQNAILIGLDAPQIHIVTANGTLVHLKVRDQIYQPDERINDVFFPIDCVLSVVTRMKDGHQIEIGTIGREGVSAIPLLLGAKSSLNESYCQVPGKAVKLDAKSFRSLTANVKFQKLLDRYVQAYVNMLGQLAACNRLHGVYERCARWLLMTQDRVDRAEIRLTHEYLAMMLGTDRSGVSIAAAALQNAGFIRYAHGVITVLNRAGLEEACCECYDVARDQFGGLLRSVSRKAKHL